MDEFGRPERDEDESDPWAATRSPELQRLCDEMERVAEQRGWRWGYYTDEGNQIGVRVANAHGYELACGSTKVRRGQGSWLKPEYTEYVGDDYDCGAEVARVTRLALWYEEAREARRLMTRLRRAWAALQGAADVPVVIDPAHEPRPRRNYDLENALRQHHNLSRRQARRVARRFQARGLRSFWQDKDVDDALREESG